ncbi:hypothetical protein [Kitasatospora sp. NPDC101183]|uniref:hypothetical protein n=1 Tax=Kitasatospora sp. NPDC101183 TaxID=3364100 RepID=UPI003828BFF2
MSVRRLIASAATAAALTLVPLAIAAPAAHAASVPTYTCDLVSVTGGLGHCAASNGAPAQGPFTNAFIVARLGPIPMDIFCLEGIAETPDSVFCAVPA